MESVTITENLLTSLIYRPEGSTERSVFVEEVIDIEQKVGLYFDRLNEIDPGIFDKDTQRIFKVYSYFNVINGLMPINNNMSLIEGIVESIVVSEAELTFGNHNNFNCSIKLTPDFTKQISNDLREIAALGKTTGNYQLQILDTIPDLITPEGFTTTRKSQTLIKHISSYLEERKLTPYITPLISHLNSIMYN